MNERRHPVPGTSRRIDRFASALGWGVLVSLVLVVAQVVRLQVAPPEGLGPFISHRLATVSTEAQRGDILDRRGRPIAVTQSGRRVFVDPTRFDPTLENLEHVSGLTGVAIETVADRVITRIVSNERRGAEGRPLIRYVSIGGVLSPGAAARAEVSEVAGVHTERRLVRESIAARLDAANAPIVGKTGVDHDGLIGLERSLEPVLAGSAGVRRSLVAADGRTLFVQPDQWRPPAPGRDVRLSLDLHIQRILLDELRRAALACDAAGARGIVVDPLTGEILALADVSRDVAGAVPFDASLISERGSPRFRILDTPDVPDAALARSRTIQDVYEPGSTFKPFVWAAATELRKFEPARELSTGRDYRTPYGRPINDVFPKDSMSWRDVLVNSSNIGMSQSADALTHGQMRHAVTRLGFGRRTNLGFPGEAAGIVRSAASWSRYTQTSVSFGQEVAVTPLQMVRAFSVFARPGVLAGTLPDLRLLAPTPRDEAELQFRARVMPRWVASLTRDAMIDVGDAMDRSVLRNFPDEPRLDYSIFGKSGTAQVARPDGRGYLPSQYISSFIGAAPVERPRILVLVVIDDPGPRRVARRLFFGSATAGPAVRRITQRTLAYLGVEPDRGGAAAPVTALAPASDLD